jgi:hypothetical protein
MIGSIVSPFSCRERSLVSYMSLMAMLKGIPRSARNDKKKVSFRDPAVFAGLRNPWQNGLSAYRAGEEAMMKGIPHSARNDM